MIDQITTDNSVPQPAPALTAADLRELRGKRVRVLTTGTTPTIGWEEGTLTTYLDEGSSFVILTADKGDRTLIPLAAITRVQW